MFSPATALTSSDVDSAIVRHPLTITPDASVTEAIAQMSQLRAVCSTSTDPDPLLEHHQQVRSSCVLVMVADKIQGIVTERDIVRLSVQHPSLEALMVRDIMTHPVVTLKESALTDLFVGVNLLRQHQIRHLPILDEQDHLVGLVTHESLRYITQPLDLLRLRAVSEVMTSEVVCATPDCSIVTIAQLMSDHGVSSVILVQPLPTEASSPTKTVAKKPIGILTERDIVQFQMLGLNPETCRAERVMSTPVFAIAPEASLWTTQSCLQQHRIQRLVVTSPRGELLGIVTQTSLLNALNPVELYKLAEVLNQKVKQLEVASVQQLESRNQMLEQQVEARTRDLQAKVDHTQLVAAIATQIRSSLSLQTILNTTVEQVRQVLGCDRVNIWRLTPDGSTIAVAESTDSPRSLVGESISDECFQHDQAEAYRQGKVHVVRDVDDIELSDCHRAFLKQIQTRSKILVPLLCGDKLWGLLNACEADKARDWQLQEVELMQALAVQLAIALQQATTHEQLRIELSAHQQTATRLRESEQRYASLVAASPVGIMRTDLEGVCIYANERYCEALGIDPTVMIGNPWFQGHNAEARELIILAYRQSLKYNCPLRVEYPVRHADGSEIWVYGQVVREYDAAGQASGYVGTITDISDRKQAESLLEEQFQILERIAKAEPLMDIFQALLHAMETYLPGTVCTIMLCQDGQLCHACAPSLPQTYIDVVETSGYPIAEGVGSCGTAAYRGEIVIAADIATDPLWQDYKQLAFAHGLKASWSVPVFDQAPDQAQEQVQDQSQDQAQTVLAVFGIYYRELRSPQSDEIEFVKRLANLAGIAIERSQATGALEQLNQELEERVVERTAALQMSERRYSSLAAAAPVAIFRFDTPLHCVYVNERWCEMTGRSADSAMGYGWLDALHPDDRVLNIDEWNRDYAQPCSDTQIIQGTEVRHLLPDGTVIWCHVNVAQELDEEGEVVGYVGTLTDITARKTAELALQESQTQLCRLTDSIPGMVFRYILHPDGSNEFTYVSSYINELYEMTPEEVLSQERSPWEIVHPDDVDYLASKIQESAQTLQPIVVEHRFILPSRGTRWGQNIGQPERLENGDVVWHGVSFDITERKATEMALRESERRYVSLAAAAPVVIYRLDKPLHISYVTERWSEMTGRPSESALGYGWMEALHPDDREEFVAHWSEVYSLEDLPDQFFMHGSEGRHLRPDGSINWFYSRLARELDEHGNIVGYIGTLTDITERKEVELALQDSQAQFRRMTENVPGMIFRYVLHPDGRDEMTYVSAQVREMYEVEPEAALQDSANLWSRIHPDDVPLLEDAVQISAETLQPFTSTYRLLLPEKGLQWVQNMAQPERLDNGDVVWDGVVLNITDRKKAETALEREVLRRSAIFDASPDGIHILDRTGHLIEANAGFAKMLGYSLEEVSRMHVADWDAQWSRAELQEILDNYPSAQHSTLETLHRRKDGAIFPVEISECSMEWDGEFALVCISRDISVRKQAETQLQHSNEELARATRLKDEFLANMSHELRTPLNVILGMTEGLEEQVFGQLNERQMRSLKAIESSGNHLLELITDILDLSKIEAGQVKLNYVPANIASLCQSSLLFAKQQAMHKQIQLNLELSKHLPKVGMMDERRIRQVLINLLTNAVKFTPTGGSVTLAVHYQHNEELLEIRVTDTGIGIAADQMPRLFQPFMQIDSALNRQYSGTGLGLALVKRLVELHGGRVEVISKVGEGSCFTVELPCPVHLPSMAEDKRPGGMTRGMPKDTTAAAGQSAMPLILIAEDNESSLNMLSSYLDFKGFRLCFARNGYEAIAKAKSESPQLVLMDIQMPDLDGLEAIRRMRRESQLCDLPIIALTALAMNGDRERCLAAGADDYLSKPVNLKQLTEMIQNLLKR